MELDSKAARRRERDAKNLAKQRANWLTRKWRRSLKGNPYLKVDGFLIVVYPVGRIWKGKITDLRTDRTIPLRDYDSDEAVKLAAFEEMNELKTLRKQKRDLRRKAEPATTHDISALWRRD